MRITKSVPARTVAVAAGDGSRGMKRRHGSRAADERWAHCAIVNTGKRPVRNKGIFQLLSGNHRCFSASRSCSYEYGCGSEDGQWGGQRERTQGKESRRAGRVRAKRNERGKTWCGGSQRGRDPISYSSGIPLDLPTFLLHLPPVRICFIYISYFSLSLLSSLPTSRARSETAVDSHELTTKYEVEIRNPARVPGETTRMRITPLPRPLSLLLPVCPL